MYLNDYKRFSSFRRGHQSCSLPGRAGSSCLPAERLRRSLSSESQAAASTPMAAPMPSGSRPGRARLRLRHRRRHRALTRAALAGDSRLAVPPGRLCHWQSECQCAAVDSRDRPTRDVAAAAVAAASHSFAAAGGEVLDHHPGPMIYSLCAN